jgi:lipoprotein LprG
MSRPVLLSVLGAVLALSGCSGSSSEETESPEEVLAAAKTQLDQTPGVTLALTTPELPDRVDGVLEAKGVGTHAPAFEGSLTLLASGVTVDVPVVAVDGVVHAQFPFSRNYAEVDPAEYGAPDPAQLLDPEVGVSSWLTAATDLAEGERTRQGEAVLSSYTGTVPGEAVAATIPSADAAAEFPATFAVDDQGRLVDAVVTGPFYGDAGDVAYSVALSDYGTEKEITAP